MPCFFQMHYQALEFCWLVHLNITQQQNLSAGHHTEGQPCPYKHPLSPNFSLRELLVLSQDMESRVLYEQEAKCNNFLRLVQ